MPKCKPNCQYSSPRICIHHCNNLNPNYDINHTGTGYDSLRNGNDNLAVYRNIAQDHVIGVKTNLLNNTINQILQNATNQGHTCPDLQAFRNPEPSVEQSYTWWICNNRQQCIGVFNAL